MSDPSRCWLVTDISCISSLPGSISCHLLLFCYYVFRKYLPPKPDVMEHLEIFRICQVAWNLELFTDPFWAKLFAWLWSSDFVQVIGLAGFEFHPIVFGWLPSPICWFYFEIPQWLHSDISRNHHCVSLEDAAVYWLPGFSRIYQFVSGEVSVVHLLRSGVLLQKLLLLGWFCCSYHLR